MKYQYNNNCINYFNRQPSNIIIINRNISILILYLFYIFTNSIVSIIELFIL